MNNIAKSILSTHNKMAVCLVRQYIYHRNKSNSSLSHYGDTYHLYMHSTCNVDLVLIVLILYYHFLCLTTI